LDLGRLRQIHHGGETGQGADRDKNKKRDELRADAGEAGGLRVRADRVDETAGGEVAHPEREED
jgi:hypothetical protein